MGGKAEWMEDILRKGILGEYYIKCDTGLAKHFE